MANTFLPEDNKLYYTDTKYKPREDFEDAGYDLRSTKEFLINPGEIKVVPTGVSVSLLSTFFGYVTGRSSMNAKGLIVHQGVIDPGYRGEIKVVLQNLSDKPIMIYEGDRIAQMLILRFERINRMLKGKAPEDTNRGAKGFGSTGRR